MFIFIVAILCTIQIFSQQCCGVVLVDLPGFDSDDNDDSSAYDTDTAINSEPEVDHRKKRKEYPPVRDKKQNLNAYRRNWPPPLAAGNNEAVLRRQGSGSEENLKKKIAVLVEQTLHDTQTKVKSTKFDDENQSLYKMGVVLSMVKKSREIMNELFNVAVRHRDEWKALEQLKIFELIIHTNVDTTNYVRHLVELHIAYINKTDKGVTKNDNLTRMVLL